MKKIGLSILALLASVTVGFAQPGPPPSGWVFSAPSVYLPSGSCVTLPQTVTGGCPAGNSINVAGGYYVGGVALKAIASVSAPLNFSGGVLSLTINSSLIVDGSNKLGINLGVAQAIDFGTGTQPTPNTGGAWEAYGANGVAVRDEITAFNNGVAGAFAIFDGRTSLGTRLSPAAVTSGTNLASFEGKGYDGSVWTGTGAAYHVYAEGTWSNTSHPGEGCVATAATGATSTTDQFCVHQDGGLTLGSPTGADEGAGTFNLASTGSIYNNGTAPTGTGAYVRATSPTLVTPALGVATATSINGLTITTTTGVLTIASAKTLTVNNSLTFTGTDSTSFAFPGASDTVAGIAAAQTLTNKTIASSTDVLGGVTMTLGSDVTGDIYYRSSGGVLTRLGIGIGSQVLGISAGLPSWVAASSAASVTIGTTVVNSAGATNNAIMTVGTVSGGVGAFALITPANGLDLSGSTIELTAARRTLPTIQTFFSGSGTYTTPANVLWIEIWLQGPGGGGAGSGTGAGGGAGGNGSSGGTCWATTGSACSSPLFSAGSGSGGTSGAGAVGGSGGSPASCTTPVAGGQGFSPAGTNAISSSGGAGAGSGFYGGAGAPGIVGGGVGGVGVANTGGGGGGAGGVSTVNAGGGGGAGASCYKLISGSVGASYTYTVGTGGTGGGAGTSGAGGGAGGSGYIQVLEHYGT